MKLWEEQAERKVSIILSQMAAMIQKCEKLGIDSSDICNLYQRKIAEIYTDELPFAKVMDSSDLVTRFEGPAVDNIDPSIGLVSDLFGDLQRNVKILVKALVGLETPRKFKWPDALDLRLAGLAQGSLVVGIRLGGNQVSGSQLEINEALDPLFLHVKDAVKNLSVVPHYVEENFINEKIRDSLPDPAVRDAMIVAAYGLAPSGRRGVQRVSFSSRNQDRPAEALTPQSRQVLRSALEKPTFETKRGDFEGVVREIDLDARRFEIRDVEEFSTLRCVFSELNADEARLWLNKRIVVRGQYEAGPTGRPRLMQVEKIFIQDMSNQELF